MFFLLKIISPLLISFIILSIPINNKTIYSYFSEQTSPYTKNIYHQSQEYLTNMYSRSKTFCKQLFVNSIPYGMDKIKKETKLLPNKEIVNELISEESEQIIEGENRL